MTDWRPTRRVSMEEIEGARSPAGGWSRAQLAEWGVPWPPPPGWKKSLAADSGPGSVVTQPTTPTDSGAGTRASVVEIYTDGACSGNPGPGGWGSVLRWGGHIREISGGEPHTTNNRMELMAAIRSLERLTRTSEVRIHTDSTYVRDGITEWLPRWIANGWQTRRKSPVKNEDLWRRLADAAGQHRVTWEWVKGHAGHPDNERADQLARAAARQVQTTQPTPPEAAAPEPESLTAEGMLDFDSTPTTLESTEPPLCLHELRVGECDLCRPRRPGVLPHGWRTEGGTVYHNDRTCDWLRKGQRDAVRKGKNLREVVAVAWATVNPSEIQPCDYCCTSEWLRSHRRE
ncbi:hypothetical protein NWFMUON74_09620 [Nocardia wallacei]|uniref:Ribonuclease H n=1 Tax=Nocardia wallacei TaxID=480035 RepID=A0A7G1KDX2_9NOCA|nr:hypothetical protein NWFMUON74_09620 [Nocardia wallacei]